MKRNDFFPTIAHQFIPLKFIDRKYVDVSTLRSKHKLFHRKELKKKRIEVSNQFYFIYERMLIHKHLLKAIELTENYFSFLQFFFYFVVVQMQNDALCDKDEEKRIFLYKFYFFFCLIWWFDVDIKWKIQWKINQN